jgi:hypothetical protein
MRRHGVGARAGRCTPAKEESQLIMARLMRAYLERRPHPILTWVQTSDAEGGTGPEANIT